MTFVPKANQHIYESICICNQDRVKFFSTVFRTWCSQGFLDAQTRAHTYARTHSQTDRPRHEYTMPPVPFFNGGIKQDSDQRDFWIRTRICESDKKVKSISMVARILCWEADTMSIRQDIEKHNGQGVHLTFTLPSSVILTTDKMFLRACITYDSLC